MMSTLLRITNVVSSLVIWVGTYVFHRWIPGHIFPPVIYTLLAVNVTSVVLGYWISTADDPGSREAGGSPATAATGLAAPLNPPARGGSNHTGNDKTENEKTAVRDGSNEDSRGRPSKKGPKSNITWLSLLTVAVNVVLTASVADVVYRGPLLYPGHDLSFARAGFVSDTSAKILLREPNTTALPVFLSYRIVDGSGDDAWKAAGSVTTLSSDSDYTVSMVIGGLQPETRYQYATSTNHSGSFVTAPSAGQPPRRNGGTYTFLTSSCLKPRFPYDPFSHPLAVPGLRHVAKWIPQLNPRFMLFLGDFIYIDVPKRFGTDLESYRRQYRMTYASPDWRPASRALPWIHVLDDHDIANDWDRNTTGVYATAIDAWNHYHASANPPPVRPGATYFKFTQGPASFFMMDTRRYRSSELVMPADSPEKTMLGPEQLADLVAWLRETPPDGVKWKIVVSSIPFTKNWRFNNKDTWGGYLAERRTVLEAMWDAGSADQGVKVIVLSGDRHEFGATKFPPPAAEGSRWPSSATVHEFSTSPLNQFYFPKRTYQQTDDEDVRIKYLPDGNSKFGAVEITSPGDETSDQSVLKYRLFIDGEEVWSYVLTTP